MEVLMSVIRWVYLAMLIGNFVVAILSWWTSR
jgi:hypothetical protein